MYIVDFLKSLMRKANIPLIVYLVLNVFLISWIISALFEVTEWAGILGGIVLYIISLTIALSPLGEWENVIILLSATDVKK